MRPMPPETSQFRLPTCVVWAWTAGALKARALARAAAPSAVDLRWDMSTPNVFNRATSTPTIRPSSISSRHGRAFRRPTGEALPSRPCHVQGRAFGPPPPLGKGPSPQLRAKALDALAGVLQQRGRGRIRDAQVRAEPEGRA